jgi:hypothetical protein
MNDCNYKNKTQQVLRTLSLLLVISIQFKIFILLHFLYYFSVINDCDLDPFIRNPGSTLSEVVSQQARYAVPNIVYHLFLFFYLFQILIYFVGSMQHGLLYLFGYGDSVFLMWLHFVLKLEPRGNSFFIGMNFFVHGWNNTSAKITIFRYPKFSSCILVVVSNLFSSSNQANG